MSFWVCGFVVDSRILCVKLLISGSISTLFMNTKCQATLDYSGTQYEVYANNQDSLNLNRMRVVDDVGSVWYYSL